MRAICNGNLVDPAGKLDDVRNLFIEAGRIAEVSEREPDSGDEIIDATGCIVTPGFIDLHVHLREPGFEYKEDIETGSRAAAAGGYTTMCCMPNTKPACDSAEIVRSICNRAHEVNLTRVIPVGAISQGLAGGALSEIEAMAREGVRALSDDGMGVQSDLLMCEALMLAKVLGLVVMSHSEAKPAGVDGIVNDGAHAARLGFAGIPRAWENDMIVRDIALAQETGARMHLAHVSTAEGIAAVRAAKAAGVAVTCEVTPHHLLLTEDDLDRLGAMGKMKPPLRTSADVEALIAGLIDGTVDAIATDHAPHAADEKKDLASAAFGVIGMETAFAVCHDRLVERGIITLARLIELFTAGPARVLPGTGGTLDVGASADVTIVDPKQSWTIDPEAFASKARNTPFAGWTVQGRVVRTIRDGRDMYNLTCPNG